MRNTPGSRHRPRKILLVERDDQARRERAIILREHGYEVEATHSPAEAPRLWHAIRPDLALLASDYDTNTAWGLCETLKRANPKQQIAFLHRDKLYLCPVLYEGPNLPRPEVTRRFLKYVAALLAV